MDPDAAAADFPAIHHQIVCLGAHVAGIGLQQRPILVHGRRERMVHGGPALLLAAPLQQRELDDPTKGVTPRAAPAPSCWPSTRRSSPRLLATTSRAGVGDDQDQVAGCLRPCARRWRRSSASLRNLAAEDLRAIIPVGDVDQALGAEALGASRPGRRAACGCSRRSPARTIALDLPAAGQRIDEDAEPAARHQIAEVDELHPEAQVGLVGAVLRHRLRVGQDGERLAHDRLAAQLLDDLSVERLDRSQ